MNVLIAIDEGEFLDCIEQFVTSREWPGHSKFRVLHVVEPLPQLTALLPKGITETIRHDAHQHGLRLVRRMAMRIRDFYKSEHIEEQVVDGFAKEAIVSNAQSWPADLIVVASHNKSLIDRLRLGSVSSVVLASANCPVAIARPISPNKAGQINDAAAPKEMVTP